MSDFAFKGFEGPGGLSAVFHYRLGTADENTILATYKEDEYNFVNTRPQPGDWMIDAGVYIGSTAILYAQLFPDAKVLCIEPLPENQELIRKNIDANKLTERITLIKGALWSTSEGKTKIFYRDASVVGSVHKFVGSAFPDYHETVSPDGAEAQNFTLADVMAVCAMKRVRLLKMDIEGAEYEVLKSVPISALEKIQTIVGEYHNITPGAEIYPRSKLYMLVGKMFEDCSKGVEVPTWGSFLFEKRT